MTTSPPRGMADDGLEAMLAAAGSAGMDDASLHGDGGAAGGMAAREAPVEDLIPHVARGANTAIYGYDIQLMRQRPWAQPGANLADYFNYDLDEASYRALCAMHSQGPNSVKLRAEEYVHKLFGPQGGGGGDGGGQGGAGGYGGGPYAPRPPGGRYFKTKPCFAFRDGMCQKGDNCPFAHGDVELQQGRAQLQQYQMSQMQQYAPPQPSAENRDQPILMPPQHQQHHQHHQHYQHHQHQQHQHQHDGFAHHAPHHRHHHQHHQQHHQHHHSGPPSYGRGPPPPMNSFQSPPPPFPQPPPQRDDEGVFEMPPVPGQPPRY
jgi:hypothetical protein